MKLSRMYWAVPENDNVSVYVSQDRVDYLDFCDLMFDEFVECLRTLEYDNYLADQLTAIKIDDIWERSVESVCDKNTIEKIRNKRIQIRREVFIDG